MKLQNYERAIIPQDKLKDYLLSPIHPVGQFKARFFRLHGIEVEFVTGSGKTQALLTLNIEDVRPISENDILSARSLDAA